MLKKIWLEKAIWKKIWHKSFMRLSLARLWHSWKLETFAHILWHPFHTSCDTPSTHPVTPLPHIPPSRHLMAMAECHSSGNTPSLASSTEIGCTHSTAIIPVSYKKTENEQQRRKLNTWKWEKGGIETTSAGYSLRFRLSHCLNLQPTSQEPKKTPR